MGKFRLLPQCMFACLSVNIFLSLMDARNQFSLMISLCSLPSITVLKTMVYNLFIAELTL